MKETELRRLVARSYIYAFREALLALKNEKLVEEIDNFFSDDDDNFDSAVEFTHGYFWKDKNNITLLMELEGIINWEGE
jgi:hypothetical protein